MATEKAKKGKRNKDIVGENTTDTPNNSAIEGTAKGESKSKGSSKKKSKSLDQEATSLGAEPISVNDQNLNTSEVTDKAEEPSSIDIPKDIKPKKATLKVKQPKESLSKEKEKSGTTDKKLGKGKAFTSPIETADVSSADISKAQSSTIVIDQDKSNENAEANNIIDQLQDKNLGKNQEDLANQNSSSLEESTPVAEDLTSKINSDDEAIEQPEKDETSAQVNEVEILSEASEQSKVDQELRVEETNSDVLKVTFQLKYSTKFGQNLFITGSHDLFGNNDLSKAIPLQYFNQDYWFADFELPKNIETEITYNYFIVYEDGTDAMEYSSNRSIHPSQLNANELLLIDVWNYAGNIENTFLLEPFKNVLLKNNISTVEGTVNEKYTHTFKVKAPFVAQNEAVIIAGNVPGLGNWSLEDPLVLSKKEGQDWWSINVDLSNVDAVVEYKYAIYDLENKKLIRVEHGENRILPNAFRNKEQTIVSDGFVYLPTNGFKGAGVAIPVFSLRTNNGLGVGEFNDIKLLVDWANNIGLKLIQILPINDTTATYTKADSYPYAAISAFALHPIYINLESVTTEANKELLQDLNDIRNKLNSADTVVYEEVVSAKLDFLRRIFPLQKEETFASPDFVEFFNTNSHWLVPYAAFCYLRDQFRTSDFSTWPTNSTYNQEEINAIAGDPNVADDNVSIHYFIQYHLHIQLKAAAEYAHSNGIIVKGDIPIGIFRNSCDAWQQPELYNMDQQAGAPPDDFAVKGQNWGFPTYNWQAMAKDGFTWWKRRFNQMSYYFDAFRIDHILGFFRIWSIPMDAVEGILGHFVPALPVHISEFHQRAISFDVERFTKPYITDAVLWDLFGSEMQPVKKQFLREKSTGNYELLPTFDTQKKVEEYFSKLDKSGFNKKLKQGLFDLISNVILFEVEESQGQQFHFRISIESTSSYQFLDEGTKYHVKELYINYFYRRQDEFWRKEAMLKLPELKRSTNMLICGEDLGMVPETVPGVMKDLAILSLEIQRMPKDPTKEFFHPNDAPYLSVVTPSTHDMSTIRGWWEEDRIKTQRFFNQELGNQGQAPATCDAWINKAVVIQHLYSPAMWSIFQLQDLLGIDDKVRRNNAHDERINIPADPKHYWRYRMHLNLEDLINENEFNFELKGLVSECGR